MATPLKGPPVQDLPPPGGYPQIFVNARNPKARGPPSLAIWGAAIFAVTYGFWQIGQTNHERRFWANKLRDNKLALVPLLQAEEDLTWLNRYREAMKEEAEVMKHVPGWKVGEGVYKTKAAWIPPSIWPYSS